MGSRDAIRDWSNLRRKILDWYEHTEDTSVYDVYHTGV
jgi:hypothetical protein